MVSSNEITDALLCYDESAITYVSSSPDMLYMSSLTTD